MNTLNLEDVFKTSGLPTHTYVEPACFSDLLVSVRSKGRGVIVEGPSGIGKTTAVKNVLNRLIESGQITEQLVQLSARKPDDVVKIPELLRSLDFGVAVIDDFHRLPVELKQQIADTLKYIADNEVDTAKLIVVGISQAGDTLISLSPDLTARISRIQLEKNSDEKLIELIEKGEQALNVQITPRHAIVSNSQGSFLLAQLFCYKACLSANVTATRLERIQLDVHFETIRSSVVEELRPQYQPAMESFARGPKLRPEGRAPYCLILRWLSQSDSWTLDLTECMANNPLQKPSITQVVEKGYLEQFLESKRDEFGFLLHFDPLSKTVATEDPKLAFYLKSIAWSSFARKVGFKTLDFPWRFDFALSFSGADRDIADALTKYLFASEVSVFLDSEVTHEITASNVEDYLAPIYRSESRFVVAIMGETYSQRIWTKFESDQFKHRFGDRSVIPILVDVEPDRFSQVTNVGYQVLSRHEDFNAAVERIGKVLLAIIGAERNELQPALEL
ncbi:MAG: ATPase [Armatimonadetes bacterium Cent15-Ar3]|nr:MAG: ATPase [Armatimonadetes bacterium Cent15-Ar3]